jgi:hypothetical protein
MIYHQSPIIILESGDLLLEVRVAGQIHLEEVVFIDEVEGNLLQVLVSCPISIPSMSEQQNASFIGEDANVRQVIGSYYLLHRLTLEII